MILLVTCIPGFADVLEKAEKLFLDNQPQEAATLMETALETNPGNPDLYLYLSIIYQQLGNYERAIGVLESGLNRAGGKLGMFHYNIGNFYFIQGRSALAEASYTSALAADGNYASAYLNRANARMNMKAYAGALSDYTVYLSLEPATPQRENIERMIAALKGYLQDEEARRLAEEARRREEEARQQALLDSVLSSLQNASEDTTNLSAESEDIETDTVETDIDD